ncbi:hypothetical protein [Marinagarivorans cellulosilyticus]|uniref:Uncharacterized protein n=1 Tax=Marinagarivorans cellulosilyticus TaxID=2721545 RepID=A0AAN1WLQ9_9GAMM|nr:hypothetical protein [Marinagarivorans cellulosilyticus]BCD99914.1 hypothetical protein MARGE09_P4116 [Marinagarivorans cellulosilyticus]
MIKKYRNALLAAAVASVAVGCGGGDDNGGENPLENPNLVGNLTEGTGDPNTHRAIAQLLGGAFYQLIGTTSTVFESLATVTDSEGTIGKVLAPIAAGNTTTAKASGVSAETGADCSLGGRAEFKVELDFDGAFADLSSLDVLAEQPIDAGIELSYTECNEPKHVSYTSDGDTATTDAPVLETDDEGNIINNILDGVFAVNLRSTTGSAANEKDYALTSSIEMKDYFIQRYSEGSTATRPNVLNGAIDLSLVTTDGTDYLLSMSSNTANNNKETGGFVRSSILAEGQVELDEDFDFQTYDLKVDVTLRNYKELADGNYQVYTNQNLVRTASDAGTESLMGILPQPSAGELAISMNDGSQGIATVTPTGLHIVTTEADGSTSEVTCSWDDVNNDKCGE